MSVIFLGPCTFLPRPLRHLTLDSRHSIFSFAGFVGFAASSTVRHPCSIVTPSLSPRHRSPYGSLEAPPFVNPGRTSTPHFAERGYAATGREDTAALRTKMTIGRAHFFQFLNFFVRWVRWVRWLFDTGLSILLKHAP